MFCKWICAGKVAPVYTFQRLSSKNQISISLPKECTCSEAVNVLANRLKQPKYLIDIIEYGKPVDLTTMLYYLPKVVAFVVHPENREPPDDWITDEPDMINDWEDEPRVKMSCGHAINPDTLYGYCWSQLLANKICICCPAVEDNRKCNVEWDFPEVDVKACLSNDERILFETRLNFNWINSSNETSQCPFCLAFCERRDKESSSVQCLYCKKAGKREFIFCWFCLQPWTDNHACNLEGAKTMLQTCTLKEIGEFKACPSVRACPNCKSLIEHDDKCKKMACHLCHDEFCFVCLSPVINGNYQCGSLDCPCIIAPIQSYD